MFSETRSRLPYDHPGTPTTHQPKIWGVATPNPSRIDAYAFRVVSELSGQLHEVVVGDFTVPGDRERFCQLEPDFRMSLDMSFVSEVTLCQRFSIGFKSCDWAG